MSSARWTLNGTLATLDLAGHAARVDLLRPDLGLQLNQVAGRILRAAALLGVQLPGVARDEEPVIADAYVRGGDLIAVYAETPARPARVEVYWRLAGHLMPTPAPLAVDVQISVQTHLLGSDPTMATSSHIDGVELLRLSDGDEERFVPVAAPALLSAADGPGCFLIRPAEPGELSYAEMVHPSDFVESNIVREGAEGELAIAQRLFPESLEKGVIRRARLRGVFLSRHGDEQASELYRSFAAEAPPLTT